MAANGEAKVGLFVPDQFGHSEAGDFHVASRVEQETRVARKFVGQELEGDEAVETRLPGLEHEPRAAAPDKFQDLELRERRYNAFAGGDFRRGCGGRAAVGRDGRAEQNAFGAKALGRAGRDGSAALWTMV